MAAALSLSMTKEAFDAFLADTYGIDGLNTLEITDARRAASLGHFWTDTTTRRDFVWELKATPIFFFVVDYLPPLSLRAASGRAGLPTYICEGADQDYVVLKKTER